MQTTTAAAARPAPTREFSSAFAWYVLIILTACYTLSFIDRQILSLLVGPIKKDLGLSDTKVGLLQGLAFSVFYTLLGLPLGRIADTKNRRNLIGVSVLLWSLFTGACSLARSFWSLIFTRIGVGFGEAGLSPAAYSMFSDMYPKERLGVALSIFYMGVFLGQSLALLVGGTTVEAVSHMSSITLPLLGTMAPWRITFLVAAVPGIPFALLVYTLREPVRRGLLNVSKLGPRATLREVGTRWSSVAGISAGMICQAICNYGFMAWAPTFFARAHHWAPGQTGRALGVIIATFGCLGMYAGGKISDVWLKKGRFDAPLRVGIPSAIGTAILFPLAFLSHSATLTLALICPALFCLALPMGTAAAALQMIFPNQVRGQVSAFYLFCLNLGGLSLGPLMPGVLNDYVFHSEAAIGKSIAITIGAGAVLMLIVFLATQRPYRNHYRMLNRAEA
ncbi:MAG TPA: MFS transporter [Bryobacteraceae bacterium]|nr:MFS transporter [Bryobacteraceae bacterium]